MIDVFTLAGPSREADVRVLARSVAELVPGSRFHWFVDATAERAAPAAADLARSHPSFRVWPSPAPGGEDREGAGGELAVPAAARRLTEREGAELVVYLAPQAVVFSPLDELWDGGRAAEIFLAPVLVRPETPSGERPPTAELRALRRGVYGLPFFALRPGPVALGFLAWWEDRARTFVPPPAERRLLRPWLNLAPALFPRLRVLRNPRLGIGRENLDAVRIEGSAESGLVVDGVPLGAFDFAGVDDGSLDEAIGGAPGDRAALRALVEWYRRRRREELQSTASPPGLAGAGRSTVR